ncbi:uncharacterized protein LOC129616363 [Condylostylus longicornis]|uniref:uncharacterized protein LOC129616363 n=1 Tax=Condylostylus longicornis TaxID=2530218 RepID=UPI00244DA030|nr:uncharacterized protein LOC129616363 [Condylostylus longicornis]
MADSDSDSGSVKENPDFKPKPGIIEPMHVRLPAYWPKSIGTWFKHVEASFAINRISSDLSKYNYVVAALPQDVAESIMDVLEDPPDNNLYNNLKEVLTSRHSMSLERRIKKLISDEEIGNRRPSEFFRHLKQLAGSAATPGEEFVKELWLSRLPHVINIALISQNVQDIQTLLKTADKIWDAMQDARSVVAPIATKSEELINQNKIANLQEEIGSLKKIIAELKIGDAGHLKSRTRSRDRTRSRTPSRKRFRSTGPYCYFHFRFGKNARKCVAPCKYGAKSTDPKN